MATSELFAPRTPTSLFLFINTNERAANRKHNDESRMLVRRHVMSTFYRKKNASQGEEGELSKHAKPSQAGGQINKFRLESYPQRQKGRQGKEKPGNAPKIYKRKSLEIATGILDSLGASMDPFSVAALPWDSHIQSLVRYCRSQHYVPKFNLFLITDQN